MTHQTLEETVIEAYGETINVDRMQKGETLANIVELTDLVNQHGTIPWRGLNEPVGYPEQVSETLSDANVSRQFTEADRTLTDVVEFIPQAEPINIAAVNPFITNTDYTDDGPTAHDINIRKLADVDGLDTDEIENKSGGLTLTDLLNRGTPQKYLDLDSYRAISDPRRVILQLLGYDCEFAWQIASDSYDPGDMRSFFKQKAILATRDEQELGNVFGWLSYHDWGGTATMTTIYSDLKYEITGDQYKDISISLDPNSGLSVIDEIGHTTSGDTNDTSFYYGDKTRWDFSGSQKLEVVPVVFFPDSLTTVPLSGYRDEFSRKHTGNFMEDARDHNRDILQLLKEKTGEINREVIRARMIGPDFTELEFTIEDFYEYIGIGTQRVVDTAATRARDFAANTAHPSMWNLQLSLKDAITGEFSGNFSSDTFKRYEQVAGLLLTSPVIQLTTAKRQHQLHATEDDENITQMQLPDDIDEALEMDDTTELALTPTEATELQNKTDSKTQQTVDDYNTN